ncbi:MAG TPA: hypothetical protein VH478_05350 [Trebonia sp.]|nr:hypothetical protein [Trebonia sp.]
MNARSWGPTAGPAGPLGTALADCATAGFSGVLHVIGAPGGTIYFAQGGVAAIETPWSPSAEVMLLRSGRIREPDWEAAYAAAAVARGHMRSELLSRSLIGAGELEAMLRSTLADAMFALAAGFVDTCRAEATTLEHVLALEPAADAAWLVAEARRRMQVLAAFPDPPLGARERVMAVPGALRAATMRGGGRDEILALADGRRTARDLAFALGHGLYTTLLTIARMRAEGLLAPAAQGAAEPDPRTYRQASPSADAGAVSALPRRHKERLPQPQRSGDPNSRPLPAVLRLLRPRAEGH